MSAAVDALQREMEDQGLGCPSPLVADGDLHRYHIDGDKPGSKNGAYWLHDDQWPNGWFFSWKTDEGIKWSPSSVGMLSASEQAQRATHLKTQAKARELATQAAHAEAASRAQIIWDGATDADAAHKYLVEKGVEPFGIKQDKDRLVIPVYGADDRLQSLQYIGPDGFKQFLEGGKLSGGSFTIGEPGAVIWVCEGYSTGASVHAAMGDCVVIAFNAGGLLGAAQLMKTSYPGVEIIVAGDDDIYAVDAKGNPRNIGRMKAEAAAQAVGGRAVFPQFNGNDPERKATDWNDLQRWEGLEIVRKQLQPQEVAEPWPEPVPLVDETLPPLPLAGLPSWFKDMIEAVAANTETPPELAAMLGLTALSTAVHRTFEIEPELGYKEPLNIWGIAAMGSGNRKTSVLNAMTAPLGIFEREQAKATAGTRKESESHLKTLESRIKHKRTEAARNDDAEEFRASCEEISRLESELPTVQAPLQLWAQDVTPEKLATVMAEQNGSLAIISDEGGVFETFAGRYNGGIPNLDLILKSHSGNSPVRIHRASREMVSMDHPSLVFGLSPQPEVLRGLSDKPGFRGRGLLARFLYIIPGSLLGERTLSSPAVPETVSSNYLTGLTNILKMQLPESGERHVLKFSEKAHTEWKEFALWVEFELRPDGRFEHMMDWAGKLPGATARVAGLLHVAEHHHNSPHDTLMSDETMRTATNMMKIFADHAIHAFNVMAADPDIEKARKILGWVQRKECQAFTQRDCHRGLQQHFPRVDDLVAGIKVLVERYIIRLKVSTAREGRPSISYEVSPAISQGNHHHGMA